MEDYSAEVQPKAKAAWGRPWYRHPPRFADEAKLRDLATCDGEERSKNHLLSILSVDNGDNGEDCDRARPLAPGNLRFPCAFP